MTDDRSEALVRSFVDSPSRRALVRALTGPTLGGWLALRAQPTKTRKRGKGGKKRRKKKRYPTVSVAAVNMSDDNVVTPAGGDPNGSGSALFGIRKQTVCGTFQFTTSTANSTVIATHIHAGLPGGNGPVVVNFIGPIGQQICVSCPSPDCQSKSTPREIVDNPAAFYAVVHTEAFPEGAVRAPLVIA